MKNLKIKNEIEVNMIYFLSNANNVTSFINEVIKPLTSVSEEQEQAIADILDSTLVKWDDADCDPEGANKEQYAALDKIIEDAAISIAALF